MENGFIIQTRSIRLLFIFLGTIRTTFKSAHSAFGCFRNPSSVFTLLWFSSVNVGKVVAVTSEWILDNTRPEAERDGCISCFQTFQQSNPETPITALSSSL